MRREMFRLILAATAGTGLASAALSQDAPDFCMSGFVLADADGDGILTLTEVEAMRAHEFGALDADAGGSVTLEEYSSCLMLQSPGGEAPDRNVSPTGSGELEGSGVQVELEGLADGALTRQEYMEAAQSAFDGTGNQEDNQLQWARAFIFLLPDETDTDVRTMSHDEYAARAIIMFRRLDVDGNGELTPEEWVGAGADVSHLAGAFETQFQGLDADASGDVTLVEYTSAGTERATRAREAAIAGGWEEHGDGDSSGGLEETAESTDGEGEVVATGSEGLAGEGEGLAGEEEVADAEVPLDDTPAEGAEEAGEAAAEDGATDDEEASVGATISVPVFQYRFGFGD